MFHNSNVFGSCIIQILYTECAKIVAVTVVAVVHVVTVAAVVVIFRKLSHTNHITFQCCNLKVFTMSFVASLYIHIIFSIYFYPDFSINFKFICLCFVLSFALECVCFVSLQLRRLCT